MPGPGSNDMPWSGNVPTAWGRSFKDVQSQLEGPEALQLPWVDALAQNILLTVQAFQRLHAALDSKFIGR